MASRGEAETSGYISKTNHTDLTVRTTIYLVFCESPFQVLHVSPLRCIFCISSLQDLQWFPLYFYLLGLQAGSIYCSCVFWYICYILLDDAYDTFLDFRSIRSSTFLINSNCVFLQLLCQHCTSAVWSYFCTSFLLSTFWNHVSLYTRQQVLIFQKKKTFLPLSAVLSCPIQVLVCSSLSLSQILLFPP